MKRRNVRYWHKADNPTAPAFAAFGGKADIALCLRTIWFVFHRRHSGRFAPADCFPGTILVSIPDASNDNVGDHTHDRRNDQRHQELAHGCGLLVTEQRKRVLSVSLRGCPLASESNRSDVRYWHKADKDEFSPGTVCLLLTQSGHRLLLTNRRSVVCHFSLAARSQNARL